MCACNKKKIESIHRYRLGFNWKFKCGKKRATVPLLDSTGISHVNIYRAKLVVFFFAISVICVYKVLDIGNNKSCAFCVNSSLFYYYSSLFVVFILFRRYLVIWAIAAYTFRRVLLFLLVLFLLLLLLVFLLYFHFVLFCLRVHVAFILHSNSLYSLDFISLYFSLVSFGLHPPLECREHTKISDRHQCVSCGSQRYRLYQAKIVHRSQS